MAEPSLPNSRSEPTSRAVEELICRHFRMQIKALLESSEAKTAPFTVLCAVALERVAQELISPIQVQELIRVRNIPVQKVDHQIIST